MISNIRKSLRHSDPTQHVRMRQRSVDDVKFYVLTLISFNNIHISCFLPTDKSFFIRNSLGNFCRFYNFYEYKNDVTSHSLINCSFTTSSFQAAKLPMSRHVPTHRSCESNNCAEQKQNCVNRSRRSQRTAH